MSVRDDLIKEVSTKIYNNTTYPSTRFESVEQIVDYVSSYLAVSLKLSTEANSNLYYKGEAGERNKFLANPFIAGVYNMIYNGKPDYLLRDRIWVTLSLLWVYASKEARFLPLHQPYKYGSAIVEAEKKSEASTTTPASYAEISASASNIFSSLKKYALPILGGVAALVIIKGRK